MLKKLIKADFRQLLHGTLPFLIAMPVAGILAVGLGFLLAKGGETLPSFVAGVSGSLYGLLLLAIIVSMAALYFIVLMRYYRSLYSDEGYLTHVLPAKSWQLLLSKSITGSVLYLGGVLVGSLAFLFAAMIPWGFRPFEIWQDLMSLFYGIMEWNVGTIFVMIQNVISALLMLLSSLILGYLVITLGMIWGRKKRNLGIFLAYFAVSSVQGILQSVISGISGTVAAALLYHAEVGTIDPAMLSWTGNLIALVHLLVQAGCLLGGFWITNELIAKKTNLE